MRKFAQQTLRKTSDIKSKLEDAILGHASARSEMMMRRRGNNAGSAVAGKTFLEYSLLSSQLTLYVLSP